MTHPHWTAYDWWLSGKLAAPLVLAACGWLARRRWLPHRHNGYITLSGRRVACTRCGTLPAVVWASCPACGRDDVAQHTMRRLRLVSTGPLVCARCYGVLTGHHAWPS